MSALQERNGSYRVLFRHQRDDQQHRDNREVLSQENGERLAAPTAVQFLAVGQQLNDDDG